MYEGILRRMRDLVLDQQYVMTYHARQEMNEDGLSVFDVEQGIITGEVVERQRDRVTGGWKYRILGETIEGDSMELVARFSFSGRVVVLTVYAL